MSPALTKRINHGLIIKSIIIINLSLPTSYIKFIIKKFLGNNCFVSEKIPVYLFFISGNRNSNQHVLSQLRHKLLDQIMIIEFNGVKIFIFFIPSDMTNRDLGNMMNEYLT